MGETFFLHVSKIELSVCHSYMEVSYDNYTHNYIGHGVLCNERWLGECALSGKRDSGPSINGTFNLGFT
jgi:hypothetical protein